MNWLGNFLLFALAQVLLVSFQSSFWMQVFGNFPSPHFWLPALVYWTLYRRPQESVAMIYLTTAVAGSLTALPFSLLLLILVASFSSLYFLKERIHWPGSVFFMLANGFFSCLFPLYHLVFSWLIESNPIHSPEVFHWLLSILLTMLVSLPLYRLFSFLDSFRPSADKAETRRRFI